MKITSLSVVPVILSACCLGQMRSGTIVVLDSDKSTIVIAADSHIHDQYSSSDDRCKVGVLGGKVIFAMSGYALTKVVGGPKYWDARDLADSALQDVTSEQATSDLPLEVARQWGKRMAAKLKRDIESYGRDVVALSADDDRLSTGIFAGPNENGDLVIAQAAVTYQRGANGAAQTNVDVTEDRPPILIFLGQTQIIDELIAQQTSRSKDWKSELDKEMATLSSPQRLESYPVELVNLTIHNDVGKLVGSKRVKTVGGTVDAVAISSEKGIYWVERNKECGDK